MSNTVAKYSFFAEIADKFALAEAQVVLDLRKTCSRRI